jgi:hypothetical protein
MKNIILALIPLLLATSSFAITGNEAMKITKQAQLRIKKEEDAKDQKMAGAYQKKADYYKATFLDKGIEARANSGNTSYGEDISKADCDDGCLNHLVKTLEKEHFLAVLNHYSDDSNQVKLMIYWNPELTKKR